MYPAISNEYAPLHMSAPQSPQYALYDDALCVQGRLGAHSQWLHKAKSMAYKYKWIEKEENLSLCLSNYVRYCVIISLNLAGWINTSSSWGQCVMWYYYLHLTWLAEHFSVRKATTLGTNVVADLLQSSILRKQRKFPWWNRNTCGKLYIFWYAISHCNKT